MKSKTTHIAFISSFPPRKCGIASFTDELTKNLEKIFDPPLKTKIFAVNPSNSNSYQYPKKVIDRIYKETLKDYLRTAKQINRSPDIKLVIIQHEFGLFNNHENSYLKKLIELVEKPIIITCHTILPKPNKAARKLFKLFQSKVKVLITMTENSRQLLINDYKIPKNQITVIPHGIPSTELPNRVQAKRKLKLTNKLVLTTFGLLSKGKGLEYPIKAVAQIAKRKPDIKYLIIGATHPEILKKEGEKYRNKLIKLVKKLGIQKNVKFCGQYLSNSKLLDYLKATDIYIATPLDQNQAVSGSLSYALGTGLPVISTAFAHAKEIITEQNGLLIKFKNVKSLTDALEKMIFNLPFRNRLAINAFLSTRNMLWYNVALAYSKLFSKYIPKKEREFRKLPKINLLHLHRLSDKFGIFQFADFIHPNPNYGYTLDDNARALIVATKHYKLTKEKKSLKLIYTYLNFIKKSQVENGKFVNYFRSDYSIDHKENKKCNLEDSNARTFYALFYVLSQDKLPERIRKKIKLILSQAMVQRRNFQFLRAKAFYVKGLYFYYQKEKNISAKNQIIKNCDELLLNYKKNKKTDWQWFEPILTYSNSILCEALIYGYLTAKKSAYLKIAKSTLDFLINKSFHKQLFLPIGQNGWHKRGGKKAKFDQQPEEIASLVQTLVLMYQTTKEARYFRLAHKTFAWFLGENTLGQFVYDPLTKGCYDGIGEKQLNFNQGAESTISYLLAREALEELQ